VDCEGISAGAGVTELRCPSDATVSEGAAAAVAAAVDAAAVVAVVAVAAAAASLS